MSDVALPARKADASDRTRVDTAVRILREDILSGVVAPDERLVLTQLAERLEMSVIPIREALKRLEIEGLVDNVPHKGARVRSISVNDMVDLYRVRIQLERYAIAETTIRIQPPDERYLRDVLDAYRTAYSQGRLGEGQELNTAFHLGLYEIAGSDWLMRAIRPLWFASERYQRLAGRLRGDIESRFQEHSRLLDLCVAGDPSAASHALEQHLRRSVDLVCGLTGDARLRDSSEARRS